MATTSCYHCVLNVPHPWHDNGEPTRWVWMWERGAANGSPIYYTKENGFA